MPEASSGVTFQRWLIPETPSTADTTTSSSACRAAPPGPTSGTDVSISAGSDNTTAVTGLKSGHDVLAGALTVTQMRTGRETCCSRACRSPPRPGRPSRP